VAPHAGVPDPLTVRASRGAQPAAATFAPAFLPGDAVAPVAWPAVARLSRLERITNLVLVLLETPRPLSLREIGDQVAGYPAQPGALRQAFERDKRTLRDNGIPVVVERIDADDQVGYRIPPEQYYLPELGLDAAEEEALAFALAAVRLEGGVGRGVQAKLGSPLPDLAPIAVLPSLPALGPLQEALRTRAYASFSYRGRRRTVAGYGLAFRSGSWYLIGRDASAEGRGLRTFRVDRIEDEPTLGEPGAFERPDGFDLEAELRLSPFRLSDGEGASQVVVEVDVREARDVVALVGEDAVVARHPDGSVRLAFRVGDEEAFVAWVLGLGDSVEVCAPEALRARVVERLESAASGGPP